MPQKVRIIGVPMDLGASRRGVDMGPSALRVAGLQARIKQLGVQVEDIGNISVKQPEEMPIGEKRAKYVEEITDACKDLGAAVQRYRECYEFTDIDVSASCAPHHGATPRLER